MNVFSVNGQNAEEQTEVIKNFQIEQNDFFKAKKTSPLTRKERKKFQAHAYYPIDLDYVVEAKFVRIMKEDTVKLSSSAGKIKLYRPFAKVYFTIQNKECELTVYQSFRYREIEEYKNYIFLPFRDANSGVTSYGGGKYLDLEIPKSNTIILNFNLAYNPYCAYTKGYNCTIPPKENTLKIAVNAGMKTPKGH